MEQAKTKKAWTPKRIASFIINAILMVVLAFSVFILVFILLFTLCEVDGTSMYPTLEDSQHVLLYRYGDDYKAGDIVVFEHEGTEPYIKRIIAVGGDSVRFELDPDDPTLALLYVNNELKKEDYICEAMTADWISGYDVFVGIDDEIVVPEDSYFVMGDNRNKSTDSRRQSVGFIEKADIIGSMACKVEDGSFLDIIVHIAFFFQLNGK